MGGEYLPAGSGTEVHPYLRQFSMDTVFAESLGFCYVDYFQEPLDVGHKGRGEYSHVGCSASANELR